MLILCGLLVLSGSSCGGNGVRKGMVHSGSSCGGHGVRKGMVHSGSSCGGGGVRREVVHNGSSCGGNGVRKGMVHNGSLCGGSGVRNGMVHNGSSCGGDGVRKGIFKVKEGIVRRSWSFTREHIRKHPWFCEAGTRVGSILSESASLQITHLFTLAVHEVLTWLPY